MQQQQDLALSRFRIRPLSKSPWRARPVRLFPSDFFAGRTPAKRTCFPPVVRPMEDIETPSPPKRRAIPATGTKNFMVIKKAEEHLLPPLGEKWREDQLVRALFGPVSISKQTVKRGLMEGRGRKRRAGSIREVLTGRNDGECGERADVH